MMMHSAQRSFMVNGVRLVADVRGRPENPHVLFLHGGGQTRFSWGTALDQVASHGFHGVSLDLRGHGESDWASDGDYRIETYAADLEGVIRALGAKCFLVGASLGGMTSLLASAKLPELVRGLILVDVVPKIERQGSDRIRRFMTAHTEGFSSVEEAADAIAAYIPNRPRPKDTGGLLKNLRLDNSGRYRWHWDPAFMKNSDFDVLEGRLRAAASSLRVPTLLIRGRLSEVVSEEGVREFLAQAPHAEYVNIEGADHMVAGDRNDAFNAAVLDFLVRHRGD